MNKQIKKINIHNITYITILLSFLVGYFELVILLLITIFIHELGHFLLAKLLKKEMIQITIYPFGGITEYKTLLNSSIKEEFLILIGGPIIQLLFLIFIMFLYNRGFVLENTFNLFYKINILLFIFNLLPIYPLDGGRLLNLLFNKFFSFKYSHLISIYISFIVVIFLLSYFYIYSFKLLYIIIIVLLLKDIFLELYNHKILFNNFILERIKYNFNNKEGRIINNINQLKRNKKHKIINNGILMSEKEYLIKYFLKNNKYT